MTHELKTCPEYFEAILEGRKTFEIRFNDRGFKEGDTLVLREYKYDTKEYTGRTITAQVMFCLYGEMGLAPNYVIMSIMVV